MTQLNRITAKVNSQINAVINRARKDKLSKTDRALVDCNASYTGIHLENIPEKVRTRQTDELNSYIPEKWNY
jgi:hypothetical protein